MAERNELQPKGDPFFLIYLKMAKGGFEAPVTIACQGLLISGTMVSYARYSEVVESVLRQSQGHGIIMANALEALRTRLKERAEEEKKETAEDALPEHFHLVGASIWIGETEYTIPAWRGNVASVNGFSLGTLTRS